MQCNQPNVVRLLFQGQIRKRGGEGGGGGGGGGGLDTPHDGEEGVGLKGGYAACVQI